MAGTTLRGGVHQSDHHSGVFLPDIQTHPEDSGLLKRNRAIHQCQEHNGQHLLLRDHCGDGEQPGGCKRRCTKQAVIDEALAAYLDSKGV